METTPSADSLQIAQAVVTLVEQSGLSRLRQHGALEIAARLLDDREEADRETHGGVVATQKSA